MGYEIYEHYRELIERKLDQVGCGIEEERWSRKRTSLKSQLQII